VDTEIGQWWVHTIACIRFHVEMRAAVWARHHDAGARPRPQAWRPALVDPEPRQQIRFCATPAGVRVAYTTAGRGPALLVPAAWIGHLELAWQDPAVRAFYAPLAAHRTVVRYDKPGCGLSDPWPGRQTLDTDLEVLGVVADELRLDRFDLLGISMAAPVSAAFAAHHPGRVGRLVLYGGFANGHRIASTEVAAAMIDLVRAHWGLGSDVLADVFLPDGSAEAKAHFARLQRDSAPTEVAARLLAQCYELDVEGLLSQVAAPTLVLHRRDDRAIPYRLGRDLAARIPGARLVSLAGRSHLPYAGDAAAVVGAILAFLDPTAHGPRPARPAGALTARQLQVAALVAGGLTNRQIAERLGIQERSAEGHLERIRQRLGVGSRAQVAAWWARRADANEVPD
jgi:pimeloyl-ACP methyl ester carboxylesterase/DNA-binding CsgD family transcriptional regulator